MPVVGAVTALAVSALAVGRKAESLRGQRSATVVRAEAEAAAEKPFAGGLIGGQSALDPEWNWDPLNLSVRCEKFLPWFRESELKHGRVAMLAWVGLVVPDIARIPGPETCYSSKVTDALGACFASEGSSGASMFLGPNFQIYLFIVVVEMLTTFPKFAQGRITLESAGDYQLGLNFLPKDEGQAKEMKIKELKNGRLAMIAFMGAYFQAQITGNGFPWLYSASPERRGAGLASGAAPAGQRLAARSASGVTMRAEGGYKMSKAVPFLPVSPALEGYVGEEEGFDPMGVSLAIDIRWLREAELKHGRVAMLATVGWIATDLGMRVPGEAFQVSSIQAHDAMLKFGAMPQMLCWFGYAELFGFLAINTMMEGKTDRKPGDFGLRALYPKDEKAQYDMQLKELRNGRLAMLAYSGIVTVAVFTGKTWPFFALPNGSVASSTGSVLCGGLQKKQGGVRSNAVAARVSSSKSLPFLPKPENLAGWVGEEQEFDPLGFSDTFDMKWLRESEIKHGRVCMVACVGFFAQQYVTFPGFAETPNALNAIYTAPIPAMTTLLLAAGWIESASYGGKITMLDMFEGDRTPGDFGVNAALTGQSDKTAYDLKLKEIQNGRLAMLGFSGMVHHNIVVNGPLWPLFPEGWAGPQGLWKLGSVTGAFVNGEVGTGATGF